MNRETWERLRTDFGNLHRAIPDFTVGPLHGIYTIEYNVGPETRADILNAFALMTRAGKLLEEVPDELLFPDDPDACDRIREAEGSGRWINFIGYFNADYLDRFREMSVGSASTAAVDMLLIRLQNQLVEDVEPAESTDTVEGTVTDTAHVEQANEAPEKKEPLPPPLDENDVAILKAFAEEIGSLIDLTRLQHRLVHNVCHRLSYKKLVEAVNRLIDMKLVHRPRGKKSGAALTAEGYERLQFHLAKEAKQAKGN